MLHILRMESSPLSPPGLVREIPLSFSSIMSDRSVNYNPEHSTLVLIRYGRKCNNPSASRFSCPFCQSCLSGYPIVLEVARFNKWHWVFRSKSLCSCAGLAGALLAVVEETDKSDSLNEAGMKKLTGSDVITAWPLFRDYITFTATVLVSLMNVRSLCQGISS
jgi:hypothetical protein